MSVARDGARRRRVLPGEGWNVVRHAGGVRLVAGRDVVSEIRADPGPTHSFFDVLAACCATLAAGPRLAVLGFAGGGLMAPLRAMGSDASVHAVDLSLEGATVFDEMSGLWREPLTLTRSEAARWLGRQRRGFDLILDDLSIPGPGGMTKPRVSLDVLPALMCDRLTPAGVTVTNVLPETARRLSDIVRTLTAPWPEALMVTPADYENRLLLCGPGLRGAATVSRGLRAALVMIGSREAGRLSVRTLA